MNLKNCLELIKEKINGKISFNENLSKLSWFNIGGPADAVFRPSNLKDLSIFLKELKDFHKNIKVLGVGSNTLIRDGGFSGIIIKLGKSFNHTSLINNTSIIAGAGATDKEVSNFALQNSLTGLEFLSCIPGTIGGAIKMNSGCYQEDISKILLSVQAMDLNGNLKIIPSAEIKFHYRGSNLANNLIFISATLKGKKEKNEIIEEKMKKFYEKKQKSQPSKIKTCGSTFKNTNKKKAWELIKESNCDGLKFRDAEISSKHCNFFINKGNAKSADLENLIEKVRENVFKKTGINLELEIQIIGKNYEK